MCVVRDDEQLPRTAGKGRLDGTAVFHRETSSCGAVIPETAVVVVDLRVPATDENAVGYLTD